MADFPSEEWLKLYVERINSSKEYQEAAATWEGDIAYVFEAEPDKGVYTVTSGKSRTPRATSNETPRLPPARSARGSVEG